MLQKAHARLRALNLSTTLSDSDKDKIRPVLKASFMSSVELDSDNNNTMRSQPGGAVIAMMIIYNVAWAAEEKAYQAPATMEILGAAVNN